nr:pyridoxamine 5'-phosphate oxidase family protein [uncultured Roseateles sp.]
MHQTVQPREQLWELVKGIKLTMFTTRHSNGHLHSRPMTTQNQQIDEDDCLWFFMSRHRSPLVDLAHDANVNLAYVHTGKDVYVSVSGLARLVEDPAKTAALWSPLAELWFAGGISDPDLGLVQVKISHAHYWNVKDSRITQLYELTKAALSGTTPSVNSDSGEIRLG